MPDAPKSAYELAMERLKKQDAEAGVVHFRDVGDDLRLAVADEVLQRHFFAQEVALDGVVVVTR